MSECDSRDNGQSPNGHVPDIGQTDDTSPSVDGADVRQHPTDHGYAWVILAACMVAVFLITGAFRSFGVLYVELIRKFSSNATMASLVQGILIFVCSSGSVCVLIFGLRRFSCRLWVITGGFLYFFGFLLSSFAGSIEFLFFSYSFLIGLGMALSFSAIVVTVGTYFDKRRGLAYGLLMAAGSLGGLVCAPILRMLLNEYSVHGALMIMAAISSHIIACGALLCPPSFYIKKRDKSSPFKSLQSSKEEKDFLVPRMKTYCTIDHRLFQSDPNIILQNWNRNNVDFPTKSRSTDMINIAKFQHHDAPTTNIYKGSTANGFCLSISAIDLHFENKGMVTTNTENKNEQIFDLKIFKNTSFLRLLFAYAVGSIAVSLPQGYLPAFAMEQGTEATEAALLITTSSLSDLIGRLMIGYISDKRLVKRSYLIALGMAINGITLCLSPLYKSYWSMVLFSVFYGFFSNFISALYTSTLLDILGLEYYRSALSVMFTGYGIVSGGTAPFIGDLRDKTGTYVSCFYLFGGAHILSSLVLFTECLSFA
ncbi:monocarboxylate transporter 12-B-like isoform X2 [Ostrea edulis]|uniref:monocarboxylate transporter 12-B-like isoform X2 n=1 Tax=Ostrea edulis TaxID=37623 RepID=UPI0024AF05BF|nr:monocarboxylate transporter 12-B-like isoform X2 [Ostrea edulis]XP_048747276.2 monocarboxylate transporter 12-B-like isoform X2 [Ostrea edulis]XP_048747277.2 monocarboxylate transporter 12-B-like isoform X2 [Ostrea edulis]